MKRLTFSPAWTGMVAISAGMGASWAQAASVTGKVHQFHLRLLAGKAGGNIVTAAALCLLVLAITGLVLWWPRKLLTVIWRSSWKKLNLDMHQTLGLYNWRTASPGFRLVKLWNRELHTGDIGGLPTRILASLISLSLPVMTITGPLIWWNRRRKLVPVTEPNERTRRLHAARH